MSCELALNPLSCDIGDSKLWLSIKGMFGLITGNTSDDEQLKRNIEDVTSAFEVDTNAVLGQFRSHFHECDV